MENGGFCYKEYSVVAGGHAGADALGKASLIVGKGLDPGVAIRAMDEVTIFERLTSGWVDDDVGLFLLLEKVAECGDIMRLGAT